MNRRDYEKNYTQFLLTSAKIIADNLSQNEPNDYINQLKDNNQSTVENNQKFLEVKEVKKFDKNNILLWLSIGFLLILLANGGNKNV